MTKYLENCGILIYIYIYLSHEMKFHYNNYKKTYNHAASQKYI